MTLWSILVGGVLRLDLNADYDRLHELVNQHKTLREMLGHSLYDDDKKYTYQTLVDNVSLLTPELLDKLNQLIVDGGHVRAKAPCVGGATPLWLKPTCIFQLTSIYCGMRCAKRLR